MSDFTYFYVLQDEARRRTMNAINKRLLITGGIKYWDKTTLCSILGTEKGNALKFAKEEWPKFYGPDTHRGFEEPWEKLAYRYLPQKDHFDLAIWQEVDGRQVLVALAVGNPSNARTHLTVKWIERFYGHNYLSGRALWPILTCAEEYGKLLGCERVLIKDPVDSGKYERYGYARYHHPQVAHGGNYFGKELT
ncbi:hypothetical protein [Sulfitobacter sp. 1A12157]|uniref:hypothetical protein n=1 Tax=Sulfitobacter sp. 1A12157 TaxID=3368594 RepID=UPI003747EF08